MSLTFAVSIEQRRAELLTVRASLEAEAAAISFDPAFDNSFLEAIEDQLSAIDLELAGL
jgi:hypothetical protein